MLDINYHFFKFNIHKPRNNGKIIGGHVSQAKQMQEEEDSKGFIKGYYHSCIDGIGALLTCGTLISRLDPKSYKFLQVTKQFYTDINQNTMCINQRKGRKSKNGTNIKMEQNCYERLLPSQYIVTNIENIRKVKEKNSKQHYGGRVHVFYKRLMMTSSQ